MTTPTAYVDPFIGVDGLGNCLCGPYLPLSLVRLGPDTLAPYDTSGYRSNRPIRWFSHTHVAGTGGAGKYGNIAVVPFVGDPRVGVDAYERGNERAETGYYAVTLLPAGIEAELTSTPRTGVHRYTFPDGARANLLFDLGAVIQIDVGAGTAYETIGQSVGGCIEVVSPREIVGRADLRGGWGHDYPYSVHFCARLDTPVDRWELHDSLRPVGGRLAVGPGCRAVAAFGHGSERSRARAVEVRVGISYVSRANARAHLEHESDGRSFDEVRAAARATWDDTLARIRVEGPDDDRKRLFYTMFTRLLCMPSDLGVDDENPLWRSGVRSFSDFYCLWDSVRVANQVITLFDPDLERDFLNCLLDVGDHVGWLPDAWTAGHSAFIQGGSSADVLLCEAALKGIDGIDYHAALERMRRNAEEESPDPRLYGRYLRDYRDLGFLSTNVEKNCVSRHLEYTYQDWCISALAAHLGEHALAAHYRAESRKVWALWNDDARGFAPRRPDGTWAQPFDPVSCRPDSWNDPWFYEGTSRQWSFHVHHDFAGLVARHGGPEGFERHLDAFFDDGHYHSKETMLHIPVLYHYAGRPDRSADRVREARARFFRPTRDGLSDNEDMGCQSAWYMAGCLGLYPIMGQDLYMVIPPAFPEIEIQLGSGGRSLRIESPGAEHDDQRYVASMTLNGRSIDRAWLRHDEIADGGVLRIERAATPAAWGLATSPPSPLAT